jgi:hypothetical protein
MIASAARAAQSRYRGIDARDYVDDVTEWPQTEITIRSAGGSVRIPSVTRTAEGKAIFVIKGTDVIGDLIAQGALTDNEAMVGFGAEGYASDSITCARPWH